MRREEDFEDDGRTIADMSEVGSESVLSGLLRGFGLGRDRTSGHESNPSEDAAGRKIPDGEISPGERRLWTLGAIKAALLVSLVYIGALGGVIALMVLFWNH